jgi:hypothetical protein
VDPFGTVLIAVAVLAVVVSGLSYIGSGDIYRGLGGPGVSLEEPNAELREEVRQLVVAGNERRLRRGEEPLDIEGEVDRRLRELGA